MMKTRSQGLNKVGGSAFGAIAAPARLAIRLTALVALTVVVSWASGARASGGLVVTPLPDLQEASLQNLVNTLLADGSVTVSNITYAGTPASAGTFTGGKGIIGFDSGIILSTGSAQNVVGPNLDDGKTEMNQAPGDADLNTLIAPFETFDATVLEFDFVPQNSVITFQYVFSSDEYNEFVGSDFNDVFAFFLNGVNVALLPGTNIAVSINNVNQGNPIFGASPSNSQYYVNNDLDDGGGAINTEMDGLTVVLTVVASVNAGQTNHIKMAIADAGDDFVDSNVFIKAQSFADTHPPVAVDDAATTSQNTPVTINVLGNDTDADGDTLSVGSVTQATHGAAVANANGTITYTPDTNFLGTDTFTYVVSDGNGGQDSATVVVTVEAPPVTSGNNNSPVAANDSAATTEDTPIVIDVLANDSDLDGDSLTVDSILQGAGGAAAINPDGTVTYTPDANFNGTGSFSYSINDGHGGSAFASVSVVVSPVNDAPLAVDDSAVTNEDMPVTIAVLANDSDVEGDALSVDSATRGVSGAVTINANGTLTYTPDLNFNGADTFTYTIVDGNGGSATATVTVTVNGLNDPPDAVNDAVVISEDTAATIPVLSNDSDPEADTLSVSSVTQPAHGAVALNADGTITYTPSANFNGSDSFSYTASDTNGATDTASVTVTVNAVNDAPTAQDDSATTDEDASLTIGVLSNDSDVDGDAISITSVSQPANGVATVNADGTITFAPEPNFNGSASFTYTITDPSGETAKATVTVTVNAVNDAPVAADDVAATEEDTTIIIAVLANDSDVDGDSLAVASFTQGAHGVVTLNVDNTLTYNPVANFSGADSFTYTVSDGNGGADTATVSVMINGVNDPPLAINDEVAVDEDSQNNVFNVLANDSDPDGTLALQSVSAPAHGWASVNPDSTVSYTPAANFSGTDQFTYSVCDDSNQCSTATVLVTVNDINDAPMIVGDAATTEQNTSVAIDVLANDSDIDGTLDAATLTVIAAPANGTASVQSNPGEVIYTPHYYFYGTDSFSYRVCDDDGACGSVTVTVTVQLPPSLDSLIRLDFREITYFNLHRVITSSDAGIRAANGIAGDFDPSLWPYDPNGGQNKTKSRGTLFRIYGFKAERVGSFIYDANDPARSYQIVADPQIPGTYYADLGGPTAVYIPVSYLQTNLLLAHGHGKPWTMPGSAQLTDAQKNVPGIMLNHNVGRVKLPKAVRDQMGTNAKRGLVDYVGFQLWGHGNPKFREFVDVEIKFVYDSIDHSLYGFRTAYRGDFEGFSNCNYLDFTPGADGARFNDVWQGNHAGHPHWGPACGSREKSQNQKVRANYNVPLDSIQLLPTVNVHDDTAFILYGEIRPRASSGGGDDDDDDD
jgi:CshA-type fibril repeat protein/VCBS repeat-containing protein